MDNRTIDICLRDCAGRYPDKIGMTDLDNNYTWEEIDHITGVLASQLVDKGVKKGEHIAIWATNSANWVFYYFAIQRIGAVAVLINVAFKWRELENILLNYDVKYIIYTRKYKESDHENTIKMLDREKFKSLKEAFILEDEDNNLRNLLQLPKGDVRAEVDSSEVASILFTSGTTGMAKGAMLTHSNLVNNSKDIVDRMGWDEKDRMCLAVPMFHCFGITVGLLGAIHTGAAMDVARKFSTGTVFKIIEEKKCTLFNGVPTMFLAMMNSSKRERFNLTSLKGGLMAGSPILPVEYMDICRTFNMERLQTAFGQTESSPAITTSLISDTIECKAYTAGKALDDVEVRIVKAEVISGAEEESAKAGVVPESEAFLENDAVLGVDEEGESGRAKANVVLGPNEEGEIQTRGYHVMKGYYNMPEETKKAIDEEGWLSTGDLGYFDKDGYLHVTGRIKDIIVRGGENISPMEVENVIIQFDEIKAVKVIGVAAKVIQEEVVACIVWKDDRRLSEETIINFVKNQLADYKAPKYVFEFDALPTNSSGKVLGKKLVKICEEKLAIRRY